VTLGAASYTLKPTFNCVHSYQRGHAVSVDG
jgi:hypothetical protein